MPLSLLTFISCEQDGIGALFPDNGVKFPIPEGTAFVNKRVTVLDTLPKSSAVLVSFLLFVFAAYLLAQVDVFDLEQPLGNVVADGLRADIPVKQVHALGASADDIRGISVL